MHTANSNRLYKPLFKLQLYYHALVFQGATRTDEDPVFYVIILHNYQITWSYSHMHKLIHPNFVGSHC